MVEPDLMSTWRVQPLFISGTFRDMGAERDHLFSHVFPALQEKLTASRVLLEPVDLRIGVETADLRTEEAKNLLVLRVCFREIERSRPFLLALLGDRYGWVPPQKRARAAVVEAGLKLEVTGKSITELEIDYGMRVRDSRALVYLRDPLPYGRMDPELAARYTDELTTDALAPDRWKRLLMLKRRIRALPRRSWRTYHVGWRAGRIGSLGPWGRQVEQDLLRVLRPLSRAQERTPPSDLETFFALRAATFEGRAALVDSLVPWATASRKSPKRVVCLVGGPGVGKSALAARLHQRLAGENAFLLANAVGVGPAGSRMEPAVADWNRLLSTYSGSDEPPEAADGDVFERFERQLLNAARHRRIVILVDALDQVAGGPGPALSWIPEPLPDNVRVILTTTGGEVATAIRARRDVRIEQVAPLDASELRPVAQGIYARYHRMPNEAVLRIVLGPRRDPSSMSLNPLWITMALDELNLVEADDLAEVDAPGADADRRLQRLLIGQARSLPRTIEGLCRAVLERAQRRYGEGLAASFAVALAMGRRGWRESDLAALVPRVAAVVDPASPAGRWSALLFSSLRRGLRAHLLSFGPDRRLGFSHERMRHAAVRRFAPTEASQRRVHAIIASHLWTLPVGDPLRREELMHHLAHADDRKRAARHLAKDARAAATASINTLAGMIASETDAPFHWLPWATSLLRARDLPARDTQRICQLYLTRLLVALSGTARLTPRRRLLEAILAVLGRVRAGGSSELRLHQQCVANCLLAEVLLLQDHRPDALRHLRRALRAARLGRRRWPASLRWLKNLAATLNRTAQYWLETSEHARAASLLNEACDIAADLVRRTSDPEVRRIRNLERWLSRLRLADAYREARQTDRAARIYREAADWFASAARERPRDPLVLHQLSTIHDRLAEITVARDASSGVKHARSSLALAYRLLALEPGNADARRSVAVSLSKLGDALLRAGRAEEALTVLRQDRKETLGLVRTDPESADWRRDLAATEQRIGSAYIELGRLVLARRALRRALQILSERVDGAPGDRSTARDYASVRDSIERLDGQAAKIPGTLSSPGFSAC